MNVFVWMTSAPLSRFNHNIISRVNIVFKILARAKKQLWASSLCHSLVLHTYVEL